MAIKHTFVSSKPDSADSTIVSSSEWNDVHVLEDATVTYAKIQNVTTARFLGRNTAGAGVMEELTAAIAKTMLALAAGDLSFVATQRVLGRNTAGAGVGQEVTASQLLDWAAATDGNVLRRAAGTWGAWGRVSCDTNGNDILLSATGDPGAPAANQIRVHCEAQGGRNMLRAHGGGPALSQAVPYVVQPMVGRTDIQLLLAEGASSVGLSRWGLQAPLTGGTLTGRAFANTNSFTSRKRLGFVSGAAAGNITYVRHEAQTWRGNAANLGGFHIIIRFGVSDAALVGTANMFAGLGANANPTDVGPETLTDLVGIGCTNGDTVLQLYAAGTAAQVRTSLGANFPVNTVSTDLYELQLYSAPNGDRIFYAVTRLNTGHQVSGEISAAASLLANNVAKAPQVWRSNGGAASAVAFDLLSMYVEQPMGI